MKTRSSGSLKSNTNKMSLRDRKNILKSRIFWVFSCKKNVYYILWIYFGLYFFYFLFLSNYKCKIMINRKFDVKSKRNFLRDLKIMQKFWVFSYRRTFVIQLLNTILKFLFLFLTNTKQTGSLASKRSNILLRD